MGRPRRLTDKERAESNAARQKRWYHRHEGFAKLKMKNYREQAKAVRTPNKPNEKVFKPNVQGVLCPHFGDELRYEAEPGVDVGYEPMEPKGYGGRGARNFSDSPAGATSGGPRVRGDGPELDQDVRHPSGSALGPAPLGDAPGASLTVNEVATYARLAQLRAKRGVQVELIL